MRNNHQFSGAFVLQFDASANPASGRWEGRIEDLTSTRSARFRDVEEMLDRIRTMLGESRRSIADEQAENLFE